MYCIPIFQTIGQTFTKNDLTSTYLTKKQKCRTEIVKLQSQLSGRSALHCMLFLTHKEKLSKYNWKALAAI